MNEVRRVSIQPFFSSWKQAIDMRRWLKMSTGFHASIHVVWERCGILFLIKGEICVNIVILGAGAIGGYIGARLMEAGVPVSFLVRERRARQLREKGLKLFSHHGDYTAEDINVYTEADEIPACDVVVLAVKSYHVEGTLPQLRQLVNGKGAKVLPFLNGMEHLRLLAEDLGEANVIGGLAHIMATLDENGYVRQTGELHDFMFGALHPTQNDICRRLEQDLQTARLDANYNQHILRALWQKYVFITAFSGVTTASRLPIGSIRKVPETLKLYQEVAREMKHLAEASAGIELNERLVEALTAQIEALPEEGTSSMHQDFRKGMPIEVESLHGGALRMAEKQDLQLPAIQTLYALLKPHENGD